MVMEETSTKGPPVFKSKPNGTPKKQLNIENILSLGWSPKINLDIGIKQTIEDYKNIIS